MPPGGHRHHWCRQAPQREQKSLQHHFQLEIFELFVEVKVTVFAMNSSQSTWALQSYHSAKHHIGYLCMSVSVSCIAGPLNCPFGIWCACYSKLIWRCAVDVGAAQTLDTCCSSSHSETRKISTDRQKMVEKITLPGMIGVCNWFSCKLHLRPKWFFFPVSQKLKPRFKFCFGDQPSTGSFILQGHITCKIPYHQCISSHVWTVSRMWIPSLCTAFSKGIWSLSNGQWNLPELVLWHCRGNLHKYNLYSRREIGCQQGLPWGVAFWQRHISSKRLRCFFCVRSSAGSCSLNQSGAESKPPGHNQDVKRP